MRTFRAATTILKELFVEKFGEEKYNQLISNARKEFEALIPQIPYIGGKEKKLTNELVNSALLIPILRALEREGLDFNEIGELVYRMFELFYEFIPQTDDIFSFEYLNSEKENAKNSKLREYSGDWVYDFVEGDGKTFSWGVNYHECGVLKFYKNQGMEHLMPIVCIADFAKARAYGYGLMRTQTRAHGAPFCDFRYIKDGTNPRAWPPDNLTEFK